MNAMKKVIMLLIGAALVLSFAGAVAADTDYDHSVEVVLQGNTGDYNFDFPASLTVNYDGSVNDEAKYNLTVRDGAFGEYVNGDARNYSIAIKSNKVDANNNWTLVNEKNENEAVVYGIYMNEDSTDSGKYVSPEYDSDKSWWNKNNTYFSERTEGISGYIFTQRLGTEEISSVFAKFTGTLTFTVTVKGVMDS